MADAPLGSRPLKTMYCTTNAVKMLESAYNDAGGLKGSLQYLSVENESTGTYSAKLKNLVAKKLNPTDLNDGNFVTDYDNILAVEAWVQYAGLTSSGLTTTLRRAVGVKIDGANDQILIYVTDTTGSAADISSGDSLHVRVYFKNSVAQFASSLDDLVSMPRTTSKGSNAIVVPFFADLTTPDSPVLENAPLGSTISQVSTYRYSVTIPFDIGSILGVRATMASQLGESVDNVIAVTQPSLGQKGITFEFEIFELAGGTPSALYEGVYLVLEASQGSRG